MIFGLFNNKEKCLVGLVSVVLLFHHKEAKIQSAWVQGLCCFL